MLGVEPPQPLAYEARTQSKTEFCHFGKKPIVTVDFFLFKLALFHDGKMADCYRHVECNHQGPKTEFLTGL